MPPNEPTETIDDVISQAIVDASPTPPNNDNGGDDDGSSQDPGATGDDAQGDDADGEAGAGGDDGDPTGDGSEDPGAARAGKEGAGDEADPEGKDGADPAAAGGDAAAKKPDGKDGSADDRPTTGARDPKAGDPKGADDKGKGPKQPDPVNDPIPDDVKGKTRARMTALVDTAKTLTTELTEARGQVDGFLKAIAETGAAPETFARHVEVLRLMNSSDPTEQRSAVKFLRTAADRIAKGLGDREPGKELEGHADLLEDVENGDLSKERAIEIANGRNARAAEEERLKRAKEAGDLEADAKAEIEAGRTELNELEKELRKSDPLYDRKYAAIKNAALALIPTIPPKQWKGAFKRLYDSVDAKTLPRATPRVGDGGNRNVPRGTGANQPMRPRQGAGGGALKAPTSDLEAVSFGIEQANARRG